MLVEAVTIQSDQKYIQITWKSSSDTTSVSQDVFPWLWLRYNCQCSKCFHSETKSRTTSFDILDLNDSPQKAEVSGSSVSITWQDGHVGSYSSQWLWERRFTDSVRQERDRHLTLPLKHWGSELGGQVPTSTYNDLMNSDQSLYEWLVAMEETGLFLIKGSPKETGILDTFAKRIAYLRDTNYGKSFHVHAKVDPTNLAYTTMGLHLHTDLPYYNYTPGIQMLHCIAQVPTVGGENFFCDGFYVGEKIRKTEPEIFRMLSTIKVDYTDNVKDCFASCLLDRKPIIQLNEHGEIVQINYNQPKIDSYIDLPVDKVDAYFRAVKQFHIGLNAMENIVKFKMDEGDIICFHNYRVLHARTAFKVLAGGERHLEGGYLDWDEVRSRRRVLEMNNKK